MLKTSVRLPVPADQQARIEIGRLHLPYKVKRGSTNTIGLVTSRHGPYLKENTNGMISESNFCSLFGFTLEPDLVEPGSYIIRQGFAGESPTKAYFWYSNSQPLDQSFWTRLLHPWSDKTGFHFEPGTPNADALRRLAEHTRMVINGVDATKEIRLGEKFTIPSITLEIHVPFNAIVTELGTQTTRSPRLSL